MCDELYESNANVDDGDEGFTDAMTGATLLRHDAIAIARAEEEMASYDKFDAREQRTGETCLSRTGSKPISCRWNDVNNGDIERVEVRSRLIAREIKQQGTDSYSAGSQPLALVRYVVSGDEDNSWYQTLSEHSCTLTL